MELCDGCPLRSKCDKIAAQQQNVAKLSIPRPGSAKPPRVCPAVTSVIEAAPPNPVAVTEIDTTAGHDASAAADKTGSDEARLCDA
jgi:hypothetical protein